MEENKIDFTDLNNIDRIISNAEERINDSEENYKKIDENINYKNTILKDFIESEFNNMHGLNKKNRLNEYSGFDSDVTKIENFYEGSMSRLKPNTNDDSQNNRRKKYEDGYKEFKAGLERVKNNFKDIGKLISEEANSLFENLYHTYKLSYMFLENLKKEFEKKKVEHEELNVQIEEKNKELEKLNNEINDLNDKLKAEKDKGDKADTNLIQSYENQLNVLNVSKDELDKKVQELSEKKENIKISEIEGRISKIEEKNSKMKEMLVSYAERFKNEKISIKQINIIQGDEEIEPIDIKENSDSETYEVALYNKEENQKEYDLNENGKEIIDLDEAQYSEEDVDDKNEESTSNKENDKDKSKKDKDFENKNVTKNNATNNNPQNQSNNKQPNTQFVNNAQAPNSQAKEEKALSIFDGDRNGIILGYIAINDPLKRKEILKENYPAFLEALNSPEIKLTSDQKKSLKRVINEDNADSVNGINLNDEITKEKISSLFSKYGNGALKDEDYENIYGKDVPNIVSNFNKLSYNNVLNLNELVNNFYSQVRSGRINDENDITDFENYVGNLLRQGQISTNVNELTSNVPTFIRNLFKKFDDKSSKLDTLRSSIKNGKIDRSKSGNIRDEISSMKNEEKDYTDKDIDDISKKIKKRTDDFVK